MICNDPWKFEKSITEALVSCQFVRELGWETHSESWLATDSRHYKFWLLVMMGF